VRWAFTAAWRDLSQSQYSVWLFGMLSAAADRRRWQRDIALLLHPPPPPPLLPQQLLLRIISYMRWHNAMLQ